MYQDGSYSQWRFNLISFIPCYESVLIELIAFVKTTNLIENTIFVNMHCIQIFVDFPGLLRVFFPSDAQFGVYLKIMGDNKKKCVC